MADTIRTVAMAVTAASLLLFAVAAVLASSNGRWVSAGGRGDVLDTRTGLYCAVDENGNGFCNDNASFKRLGPG